MFEKFPKSHSLVTGSTEIRSSFPSAGPSSLVSCHKWLPESENSHSSVLIFFIPPLYFPIFFLGSYFSPLPILNPPTRQCPHTDLQALPKSMLLLEFPI